MRESGARSDGRGSRRARRLRRLAAGAAVFAALVPAAVGAAAPVEVFAHTSGAQESVLAPSRLGLDSTGTLLALAGLNVQRYDALLAPAGSFTATAPGEPGASPTAIGVGADGVVRVATMPAGGPYELRTYDGSGTVLATVPFSGGVPTGWIGGDGAGNSYVGLTDGILVVAPDGGTVRTIPAGAGPFAVTVPGEVYARAGDTVERFSDTSVSLGTFGGTGISDGRFSFINAVAVDEAGDVYVVDASSRVQRFTGAGQLVGVQTIPNTGQLGTLFGYAVTARGSRVFVAQAPSPQSAALFPGLNESQLVRIDTAEPLADLVVPARPLTGRAITLDGRNSFVPLSAVERYEWDVDGNGTFEIDSGTRPTVEATYPERGPRTVRLRVTAPGGRTAVSIADLDVRPAPLAGAVGVSINDGARYTNSPIVRVRLVWRAPANQFLIADDGGFVGAEPRPVAESVPFALDDSGDDRLPRTVYVRFGADGVIDSETYQDGIILDRGAPQVTVAVLLPPETVGGRRSYTVRVRATDAVSGIEGLQLAVDRAGPLPFAAGGDEVTVTGGAAPRFVRARDRAGNLSPWRRITLLDRTPPSLTALRATVSGGRVTLRLRLTEAVTASGRLTRIGAVAAGEPRTRTITRRRLAGGLRRVPVGALPPGRYTLRLDLRDAVGNRRVLERVVRVR